MVMRVIYGEGFFKYIDSGGYFQEGFVLFGAEHLGLLAALMVLAAPICVYYPRLGTGGRRTMLRGLALVILALEVAKQLTFPLMHNHYCAYELPLHMCSISIVIGLVYAYYPGRTSGELLYCLCMPGAIAGIVYPNWSNYPILNFYSLHSFVIHALQIAFVVMLLLSGEVRPRAKNLRWVGVFLAVIVPPIYALNIRLGTNFFFVNAGSYGSPLEIFVEWLGNPGFLIPYAGLILAVWFFMYLPWELKAANKSARE